MSAPQLLTADLLDRFAQVSADAGGPLREVIGPGISEQEIQEILRPLSPVAPHELSVLWQWGTMPEHPADGRWWEIHSFFTLLPPRLAVEATLERAEAGLQPHTPSWIVFAEDQDPRYLVVDADSTSVVSPVIRTIRDSYVGAASMGDLFAYWIGQIENGDSYFENGLWLEADDASPPLPLR